MYAFSHLQMKKTSIFLFFAIDPLGFFFSCGGPLNSRLKPLYHSGRKIKINLVSSASKVFINWDSVSCFDRCKKQNKRTGNKIKKEKEIIEILTELSPV